MEKQKINIIHYQMTNGGIEISLVNFVNYFKDKYDIVVYTVEKGMRDDDLKCEVKTLLTEQETKMFKMPFKQIFKLGLGEFFKTFMFKISNKLGLLSKKLSKRIDRQADISLCYTAWDIPVDVAKRGFKSKTKMCLVHADVEKAPLKASVLKKLKCFGRILCVSESCENHFRKCYPNLASKAGYLYNMQNDELIIKKSKEFKVNYPNKFNMVSVSRLSPEKAHTRTLAVLKRLSDEGFDFVWNIVGDGECRQQIESAVKNYELDDKVVFHGNQLNPYPYILPADLFVLGSLNEAAPMVFGEAMVLGVPVLSTNTCSAKELVAEKGFVCENSEDAIYETLKQILSNKKLIDEKKKLLKNYSYNNLKIEEHFKNLVDGEK